MKLGNLWICDDICIPTNRWKRKMELKEEKVTKAKMWRKIWYWKKLNNYKVSEGGYKIRITCIDDEDEPKLAQLTCGSSCFCKVKNYYSLNLTTFFSASAASPKRIDPSFVIFNGFIPPFFKHLKLPCRLSSNLRIQIIKGIKKPQGWFMKSSRY